MKESAVGISTASDAVCAISASFVTGALHGALVRDKFDVEWFHDQASQRPELCTYEGTRRKEKKRRTERAR